MSERNSAPGRVVVLGARVDAALKGGIRLLRAAWTHSTATQGRAHDV